jgi:uncharacterized repeat protein (TIGR01451 family)
LAFNSYSGGAGNLTITGNNATLSIGEHGTGSFTLDSDWCGYRCIVYDNYLGTEARVTDATNHSAQVFVGRYPDGHGVVRVNAGSIFVAGDVLRIGLDENDQPGGIGEVTVDSAASVKTGFLKVGPQGKFSEIYSGNYISQKTSVNDIFNQGTVYLTGVYSIPGDVFNSGSFSFQQMLGSYLTIGGDLTLQSGGKLISAGGNYEPGHTFYIKGTTSLDGTLEIDLYNPMLGIPYTILTAVQDIIYGPNFQVNVTGLPSDWTWQVVTDSTSVAVVINSPSADLSLSLSATPDLVLQGETIYYTASITNNGPSATTGVYVSGMPTSCYVGNLAVGATASCTSSAIASTAGTLTLTATASSNYTDPDLSNNSKSVSTTVNSTSANLSLNLTATPASVTQGGTVSYTMSISNNGPSPATGVVASGTLPACTIGNLAASATVNCTATVTASTVGTLTQTMTVSGNETDSDLSNNSKSVNTTVNPGVVDLSLTLTASDTIVLQGAAIDYVVSIKNIGTLPASGVVVSGTLPTCNIGNLAVGATASCYPYAIATDAGTLTQTMTASANEVDPDLSNNSKSVSTTVNPSANLLLAFSYPASVLQGETISYTVNVTNYGPSPATGVTVIGSSVSACIIGNMAVGVTASCTFSVTTINAGTLTQTFSVSGNETDRVLANNSASGNTTVYPTANLSLNLTAAPASVTQGGAVSYTVSVTNNGPSPATGVTATGTLPTCNIGNLAVGASASCASTVIPTVVGTLTQTMTASVNEADLDLSNNTQSVSTSVTQANTADLVLTMTDAPDPVKKGAKLVYTLNVLNNGPVSATNVSLKDVLPASIIFVSASSTKGSCSGKSTVTCAIGTLSSGATATVTITIKPTSTGTYTNSASVTATEPDSDTSNNSKSVTTTVTR